MAGRRVLVIEDDEMNMKLVRTLLQFGNYDVLEAWDAESGIVSARENKPDLILIDIQLPGMDGLGAAHIMKQDESLKDIPIVALTALARGNDRNAVESGCDGFITKPIDTHTFLDSIAKYISD